MFNSKLLYKLVVAAAIGAVLYAVIANYIYDPSATRFLSQKMDLKRALQPPIWLNVMYVHVAFACIALLAGAFNFSNAVLRKPKTFHRMSGYTYLIAILIVDITSGYMAPYSTGGKATSIPFNLLNIAWPIITIIAISKIRKKQLNSHRRWMVRSYVFCFTNAVTHLSLNMLQKGFDLSFTISYTVSVYISIIGLWIVAEVINRTVFKEPLRLA
ncbi:DUF2306 domain-containing protein [Paenibacillus sp. 1011MAR3C5]|uniref:DUF2306 domain-containing protein n=1 Tax=Paenibacillus sp. 1011MAR3C5 TaxID=1675787 RepID=UPI000E6BDDA3|nr:DUF2306 domain-containing protein [Paenibacillus sp. 1011MAR3C5]RJE88423.1 DUF2306 domain-containing protein [Paenibacillus sp. 1011MAR3C5]